MSEQKLQLSRRDVLRATAAGAAVAGLAGVGYGAGAAVAVAQDQIAATPPAAPTMDPNAVTPASFGPTIASKAAELEYDADRIFRFVADEVRYEPYSGALRGPVGALWALAGNSVDKSLLLAALLNESQILIRFATGALSSDGAARVLSATVPDPDAIRAGYGKALLAAYMPTPDGIGTATPEVAVTSSPDEDKAAQSLVDNASAAQQLAGKRMGAMEQILADALSEAKIAIPAPAPFALPEREATAHTWIQTPQGPEWVHLDPTLAGARQGDALATVATTADQLQLGSDIFHAVTIRVVAEEVVGGAPARRDAATYTTTSADIGSQPVTIGVTPPSGVQALGASITELGSGVVAYYPYITVGGKSVAYATTPVTVTSGDQGLGAAFANATPAAGAAEGELLGLWYAIDIASPGREPVSIEREIYDRVGFANRGGTIDLTKVPPIQLATGPDGTSYAPGLSNVVAIGITSADLPSSYAFASEDPFGGLSSLGATHSAFWGSLLRDSLLSLGVHAFVDAPQVTAFSLGLANPSDPTSDLLIRGDLVLNQRTLVPAGARSTGSPGVHPAVRAGVLAQVAESVLLAPQFWSASGQITTGTTVADVFSAAAAAGTKIVVLSEPSAIPTALPGEASLRILAALQAGLIVVVPEAPVSVGSSTWTGWWTIDPTTGATSDMMQNGMGYASVVVPAGAPRTFQDAAEEAEILTEVNKWTPWYQRLGKCIAVVALLAAAGIDPTSINAGTFTTAEGAAKVLLRLISRNPSLGRDIADCF